jgi:ribosomal RNA small subunit methyltransferase A
MSAIDDLPPLRDVIREHSLSARKSLGQNFLLDLNLTARIARAAGPLEGATIIEVGPGPGGLTRALLALGAKRVIAVERDERALAPLDYIAKRYPGRLDIVHADAQRFDPRPMLGGERAKIVANLPYNIATALLVDWLSIEPWPPWYDMMVLMFQREVAERIVAQEDDEAYGRLAVLANWRTETKILFDISPAAFVPQPKVTSSVVRLRPAPQDAAAEPQIALRRPGQAGRGRRGRRHPAGGDHSGLWLCCHGPRIDRYTKHKNPNALKKRLLKGDIAMALMRRQSLVKFDAPLCETIVDTPKPQGREVLVRIERCGLCHSDLHIQDGYADLGGGKRLDTTRGMTLPFTLGHEIAGIVDEVGPDAPKELIGKKQAVFPWIGCGQCRDCANGDENLCVKQRFLGVSIDGGFATHVLVPDAKYLLDYDPLPVNQAATLMCSGVTAYGALKRLVDRPRQRNLLLIGLGGVGMMGLSFAQAMFKQNITVADLSPAARETALKNGAANAYDPAEPEIVRRILKETEGGFDGVVDFAGNEKSMAFAVSVLARGGKVVVSGLMGGNFSLPMVQWVYKRMTIEGFMVGTLAEAKELMTLARAGKIKPTPMKEEPMADVQKWIEELRAGKVVGRIVLKN